MQLGAYTACLHDKPLEEALALLRDLGLTSAEVNSGGFLPAPHLPAAQLRTSAGAREDYLRQYADAGITLTALNCNGNPLHPDRDVRDKHAQDVLDAIEIAALLGVRRVVTMSGLPAADPGGRLPAWSVLPWDSAYLDARDYQWDSVALPYWHSTCTCVPAWTGTRFTLAVIMLGLTAAKARCWGSSAPKGSDAHGGDRPMGLGAADPDAHQRRSDHAP